MKRGRKHQSNIFEERQYLMHESEIRVLVAVCALLLLIGCVQATTVYINVYEKTGNITKIPHASVYVNGALAGKTGPEGNLTVTSGGTSDLNLSVTMPGYEVWTGTSGMNQTTVLVQLMRKNLTLTVTAYDADTLSPLAVAEAKVSGENTTSSVFTDNNGTAKIGVKAEGVYTLAISAKNYQPRTTIIEMDINDKEVQYALFRDDRFSILVKNATDQTPVEDAEIYIDGNLKGSTDSRGVLTFDITRDKVYNIKVEKAGYEDYLMKALIGQNDAVYTVRLEKAAYQAFISVYNPEHKPVPGVQVLINGTFVGTTNQYGRNTIEGLFSGQYEVEVRHEGFVPQKLQVSVTKQGEDISVDLSYEQVNTSVFVEDADKKVLPGTSISLNGVSAGITDEHGLLQTRLTMNTPYNITASKDGYRTTSVQRQVSPGNTTTPVTVTLEKNFDWLPVIIGGVIIGAVIAAAAIILAIRRRNPPQVHHVRKDEI